MTGFTLIELVVTVAMAAIVLTVGVPSFKEMTINNRLTTATNMLVGSLNLARSEAIKRGKAISICKSNTGTSCTGSGTQWEDGWIVFVNEDKDSPAQVDSGEEILRVLPGLRDSYSLRSNNFTNFLTYKASGQSNNNGRFVICHENQIKNSRAIFINKTGRVRIASDADKNQIPEDNDGNDITSCSP